jgi:hypothetical protein
VRRSAQDDDFVGILTENILNKLALMGRSPGLHSDVPTRLMDRPDFGNLEVLTKALKPVPFNRGESFRSL